jgi:hypothetical protein
MADRIERGALSVKPPNVDEVTAARCPTFVAAAESDPVASNAKHLYDALTCPKTFLEFSDADARILAAAPMTRALMSDGYALTHRCVCQ